MSLTGYVVRKGSSTSGNHGHAGRPGFVGGSATQDTAIPSGTHVVDGNIEKGNYWVLPNGTVIQIDDPSLPHSAVAQKYYDLNGDKGKYEWDMYKEGGIRISNWLDMDLQVQDLDKKTFIQIQDLLVARVDKSQYTKALIIDTADHKYLGTRVIDFITASGVELDRTDKYANVLQLSYKQFTGHIVKKGGPASGNYGHRGRPGMVGGSSRTGGITVMPAPKPLEHTLRDLLDTKRSTIDYMFKYRTQKSLGEAYGNFMASAYTEEEFPMSGTRQDLLDYYRDKLNQAANNDARRTAQEIIKNTKRRLVVTQTQAAERVKRKHELDTALESYKKLYGIFGDDLVMKSEDLNDWKLVKVLNDVSKLPDNVLTKLHNKGLKIYLGSKELTSLDQLQDRKGIQPRGWPEGSTMEDVGGVYVGRNRKVVISSAGRDGSESIGLHEVGHAIGHLLRLDNSKAVKDYHDRFYDYITPYEKQDGRGGSSGRQEFLAESVAYLYTGKERYAKEAYIAGKSILPDEVRYDFTQYDRWLDKKLKAIK